MHSSCAFKLCIQANATYRIRCSRLATCRFQLINDQYDILLADIGMPDEDGFSLIRQVRALDAGAGGQIPAAAVTAYVSDKEQQKALDAGFQSHIPKPVDLAQMVSAIISLTK